MARQPILARRPLGQVRALFPDAAIIRPYEDGYLVFHAGADAIGHFSTKVEPDVRRRLAA